MPCSVQIGMFLAFAGLIGGLLSGVALSYIIDNFSQDVLPAYYEETSIPAEVRLSQIVIIISLGGIFCFGALTFTMRKIADFNPSDILRG